MTLRCHPDEGRSGERVWWVFVSSVLTSVDFRAPLVCTLWNLTNKRITAADLIWSIQSLPGILHHFALLSNRSRTLCERLTLDASDDGLLVLSGVVVLIQNLLLMTSEEVTSHFQYIVQVSFAGITEKTPGTFRRAVWQMYRSRPCKAPVDGLQEGGSKLSCTVRNVAVTHGQTLSFSYSNNVPQKCHSDGGCCIQICCECRKNQ